MNLQEYIDTLQKLIEEQPELAEAEVWTADDEEGNGYQQVGFPPCVRFIPKDSISYGKTESCYDAGSIDEHISDWEGILPEDFDNESLYNEAVKEYKETLITAILLN